MVRWRTLSSAIGSLLSVLQEATKWCFLLCCHLVVTRVAATFFAERVGIRGTVQVLDPDIQTGDNMYASFTTDNYAAVYKFRGYPFGVDPFKCAHPCYYYDELSSPAGEHRCTAFNNCQCRGQRECSGFGFCVGDRGYCPNPAQTPAPTAVANGTATPGPTAAADGGGGVVVAPGTFAPTVLPTAIPTGVPTAAPTLELVTLLPTSAPTAAPVATATPMPTLVAPTGEASGSGTPKPTEPISGLEVVSIRFGTITLADVDEQAFKKELLEQFLVLGVASSTVARLEVALREGSVIADVRVEGGGGIAVLTALREALLGKAVVVQGASGALMPAAGSGSGDGGGQPSPQPVERGQPIDSGAWITEDMILYGAISAGVLLFTCLLTIGAVLLRRRARRRGAEARRPKVFAKPQTGPSGAAKTAAAPPKAERPKPAWAAPQFTRWARAPPPQMGASGVDAAMAQSAAAAAQARDSDLEEGWEEVFDGASGRTYFAHRKTGRSQWERPTRSSVPVTEERPRTSAEWSATASEEQRRSYHAGAKEHRPTTSAGPEQPPLRRASSARDPAPSSPAWDSSPDAGRRRSSTKNADGQAQEQPQQPRRTRSEGAGVGAASGGASGGRSTSKPEPSNARGASKPEPLNSPEGGGAAEAAPNTPLGLAKELSRLKDSKTAAERRRWFLAQCLKHHPDKNSGNEDEAKVMFQILQEKKEWFLAET
eukprot:TRINITY_DN21297_c0_g1_i2.p1 TRINITY_DN21297_c0_g1~~TRINITY_DN21297_c0_g1_i2.p1  ORF type:complete len:713 (+),score=139.20 TRINITY_DN21297_c0_g1_i2:30-2168(+)